MPEEKANPIVAEIDDFIEKNNLEPIEKLVLRVMKYNYMNSLSVKKHIEDKELHTPQGILLRAGVVGWFIFVMILISTIVTYLPDKIAMLTP